jgi:hypothetical protein
MTDHEPNDLSHLSDAEFNSLCPQGEHAPGPQPLSPAAQAVLDAAFTPWETTDTPQSIAAAALRAAAEKIEDLYCESDVDSSDGVVFAMRQLMLIADELENSCNPDNRHLPGLPIT